MTRLEGFPGVAIHVACDARVRGLYGQHLDLLAADHARGTYLHEVLGFHAEEPVAVALRVWLAAVAGGDDAVWELYEDEPPAIVPIARGGGTLTLRYRPLMNSGAVVGVVVFAHTRAPARGEGSWLPGLDRVEGLLDELARDADASHADDYAAQIVTAVQGLGDATARIAAVQLSRAVAGNTERHAWVCMLRARLAELRRNAELLRDCPLPDHFLAELAVTLERADSALRVIATLGPSTETFGVLRRALADMRANAESFSVASIASLAAEAEAAAAEIADPATTVENVRSALERSLELLEHLRPIAPLIARRQPVDVVARFLDEAERLHAELTDAVQRWCAYPRSRSALAAVLPLVYAYSAAARRYRLPAIAQRVRELRTLVVSESLRPRVRPGAAAVAADLAAEIGQHLALYRMYDGDDLGAAFDVPPANDLSELALHAS